MFFKNDPDHMAWTVWFNSWGIRGAGSSQPDYLQRGAWAFVDEMRTRENGGVVPYGHAQIGLFD
jgi:hypothetical protein